MDLRRIELFVRVVERGSFTAAAAQLGLPKSSVSRGVTQLEEQLGVALLRRTTRKIALTDAGRLYFEQAQQAIATLESAATTASDAGRDPEGLVRMTAPSDLSMFLAPILKQFRVLHPRIRLELSLTPRTVDLVEEGLDLAVRAGRKLNDSSLVARRVSTSEFGLYAARDYIKRRGTPKRLADLAEHDCVVFRSRAGRTRLELTSSRGPESVDVVGQIAGDDMLFVLEAVSAGSGIGLLPCFHGEDPNRMLVRVLPHLSGGLAPACSFQAVRSCRVDYSWKMTSSVRWVGLMFFACGGGNAIAPPTTVAVSVPEGVTRYIVGGDSRDDSAHVLPWAFREAKARGAHAFFFLGDMELTPWFDAHFRTELGSLDPIPFYPVLGNHEVRVLGAIDIGTHHAQNAFRKNFLGTPHTPVMSELTNRVVYSVNLPGHVHFVALDNVSQNGFGDEQLAWLDEDLRNARFDPNVRHIFVGMHKPLAHNGVSSHGMDADGDAALADSARALEMFQRAHVDLVLASHVHRFARFDQGGIRSYVTGGLGAPLTPSGPDTAFHHFLVIDVVGDEVKVEVVRFDGKPSLATDDIED